MTSGNGRHPETRTFQRHEDPLIPRRPSPLLGELDAAQRAYYEARRDALYMELSALEKLLGMTPPPTRRRQT